MPKKYASLSTLSTFLNNLKDLFATKTSVNELSDDVTALDSSITTHINEDIHLIDGDREILDSELVAAEIEDVITFNSITIVGDVSQNDVVLHGSRYEKSLSMAGGAAFKITSITINGESVDLNLYVFENDSQYVYVVFPEVTGDIVINTRRTHSAEPV